MQQYLNMNQKIDVSVMLIWMKVGTSSVQVGIINLPQFVLWQKNIKEEENRKQDELNLAENHPEQFPIKSEFQCHSGRCSVD